MEDFVREGKIREVKRNSVLQFLTIPYVFPDFRRLFEQLNTVQGSHESRLQVVKDMVQEASRFKRHTLVKMLTQFLESMVNPSLEKVAVGNNSTRTPSLRVNGHSR